MREQRVSQRTHKRELCELTQRVHSATWLNVLPANRATLETGLTPALHNAGHQGAVADSVRSRERLGIPLSFPALRTGRPATARLGRLT